jgi:hypothetical protein
MTSPCREFLSEMLELAPEGPPAGSALGRHLELCEDCRRAFGRMGRLRAALGSLARLPAPQALDGRVVAATQAGQRQERVLAHLRAALRHDAPEHLDTQVGGILGEVARVTAPPVLQRLVEEELRDPQHALARRYVSRLRRLGPPPTLRERVHQALGLPRRSAGRNALLAGAALAVLLASIWGWWSLERARVRPRFQVVYVDDVRELDPLAREMILGATGGLHGEAR